MKNNIEVDKDVKNVLVIGANGFLGSNLLRFKDNPHIIEQKISLIAGDLQNSHIDPSIPFNRIDITNAKKTNKIIQYIKPEVIILAAAMTNVDRCEIEKKLATKINVKGTNNVLKASIKANSKLIFLSTDFIFDGGKDKGYYTEKDTPNPLSHYAKTKYEAEVSIINSECEYLICRSSVLYGWNKWKLNFITWIMEKLNLNQKLSIVTTQINSPTFIVNLAQIILKLIENNASGIYNTAGDCALSRYEIGLQCAEIFQLNKDLVKPIEYLEQIALRPGNVSLDLNKLKKLIGPELKIFNLEDGLNYMKNTPPN